MSSGEPPLLLDGALVLTLDEDGTAGRLAVLVDGGRIAGLGDAGWLAAAAPGARRIDCDGRVLIPGLVNAHIHPEMTILKGLVEELGLHDWGGATRFNRALAFLGSEAGRWAQRVAVRAALVEAALSGTTLAGTYGVTAGADEVAAEELERIGLHGHVTLRDVEFRPAEGPGGVAVVPAWGLRPPRLYRLHAEEALTPAELAAAAAAHARGERLVMHAAETEHRIALARERFGASTVRLLERYGLLSERVVLSHAVHLDAEERELLAARGAPVVSSPVAEMKLGDGIAPIHELLELGVTVGLGTDSAICNNSGDLLLECRQMGLTQKLTRGASVLPAERILRCATRGGAAALGEGADRGCIAPGFHADLTLLDARSLRMRPLVHREGFSNVAANLIYAATGQDVTDVMVGGRWIVRDRRTTTVDAEEVAVELERAADELYRHVLDS